jgi:endonuclease/exonuclease/phosphatase family metal-dependent hydrolase
VNNKYTKNLIVLTLFIPIYLLIFNGCNPSDPFHTQFDYIENAKLYEAKTVVDPAFSSPLKIMDWNVKFGGGRIDFFFDCYDNRVLMSKDEVLENIQGLVDKINQIDPDILLVQEIDTDSKRSAYVNQVQWLLDKTNLNYAAYASQWKADFVPSDGIGRVNSGNAILSKYPILSAKRISLPLISDDDALTQYFYLQRNILKAIISVDSLSIAVVNTHTSAFSNDGTKEKQIIRFKEELDKIDLEGTLFIAGGDLNAIPPGTDKTSQFNDSVCTAEEYQADDYSEETTWLSPLYSDYFPAIPLSDYNDNNSIYFSHTTDGNGFWNRKLDYLFTNGAFVPASGLIHQDINSGGMQTMPLSDHAPLTVELVLQ